MEYKPTFCSLLIFERSKNKRFLSLANEVGYLLDPYKITGLPRPIEKIVLKNPNLASKMKISHIWIFYQKNFFFFITIVKPPQGPLITFEVTKFALKKEIGNSFPEKDSKNFTPLLLLNNFSSNKKEGSFIKEILKTLFPIQKSKCVFLTKFLKIILIDYNDFDKKIEFRCYKITRSLILLPRWLRKKKKQRKRKYEKLPLITPVTRSRTLLGLNTESRINLIRPEEIGPRLSGNLLDVSMFP
mmetsp:Transcript_46972/g.96048  ORF Transcript_46972/g.96048 Transcript_46972/m.96048 type:complete len:243 (-) Transcript_46972:1710-2438(-)